jgi:Uma2 family endonuclease
MATFTLPLKVDFKHVHLTDEQFYQVCINNPDLTIERSAKGALIFMTPVGGQGGSWEMDLGGELYMWNKQTGLGKVFIIEESDLHKRSQIDSKQVSNLESASSTF